MGARTVSIFLSIPVVLSIIIIVAPGAARGEDLDLGKIFKEGIPRSPFVDPVYAYADAMLQSGRDLQGPVKTGLFLSALDRKTLSPLAAVPPAPEGVRAKERPGRGSLAGANLLLDQDLLRLLFFLKGLTSQDQYPQAAEAALGWFLKNAPSQATGLFPWGEHLSWDALADKPAAATEKPIHELSGPWLLWDKCFDIAPEASRRFALALWERHVVDKERGLIEPRAGFDEPLPSSEKPAREGKTASKGTIAPRQAGFFIRTWAEAHARTGDAAFLKAIEVVLRPFEANGALGRLPPGIAPFELLSLAVDCDGAARKVPEPLRSRLLRHAERADEIFLSAPHDLKGKKGFAAAFGGDARGHTPLWDPSDGGGTTAKVAAACVSRYENRGDTRYRDLLLSAAEAYLESLPPEAVDAWPATFAHAISLELAAFRVTAREDFYRGGFRLGEAAIEKFFSGSALPRASIRSEHYESTTGAPALALALAELHLTARHITAVRAPANTADR